MAKIFLITLLASGSFYFIWLAITEIVKSTSKINDAKILNKKIKKWKKVSASVVELGYNLDYCYPGISHDVSHIDGELAREAELIRLRDEQLDRIEDEQLYGKIMIKYTYKADDKHWIGRTIGPIPNESDMKILYRLNIGSKIKVFVNPEDPGEAYIKSASKDLMEEMSNQIIMSKLKYFAYSLILGVLALQAAITDLPAF